MNQNRRIIAEQAYKAFRTKTGINEEIYPAVFQYMVDYALFEWSADVKQALREQAEKDFDLNACTSDPFYQIQKAMRIQDYYIDQKLQVVRRTLAVRYAFTELNKQGITVLHKANDSHDAILKRFLTQ